MLFANKPYAQQVSPRPERHMVTGRAPGQMSRPRVLLVTAYRWPTATRLALALFEAGFTVEALCPARHSLTRVKFVSTVYRYNLFNSARGLRKAITTSKADLIVPTDDIAAAQLHQLYKVTNATDPAAEELRSLIVRSLGDPGEYPSFHSRSQVASLAHSVGVCTPVVTNIRNENELLRELETVGFPAVLKTDGSSGGKGVIIVHDRVDAERAFKRLAAPPDIARTLKSIIVDRHANLVVPCVRRSRALISVQRFIDGTRANVAAACWQGTVLARVCVEVLASNGATGSSTVVKVIAHPGMSEAVERMVRGLKLSGLCGFDFILNSTNDRAYLIDFNPRATQTCHLVSSEGNQLLASLAAKLRGSSNVVEFRNQYYGPVVLFPYDSSAIPEARIRNTFIPTYPRVLRN